jgi:hypothetical protein
MKSLLSWLATPCVLLAGCAHGLLPQAGADATSGFKTFGEAQAAFVQIVPSRTTTAELTRIGFDIAAPNVRQIPYPDLVARLAPNGSVAFDELDPGIRQCILARLDCRLYEFRIGQESRARQGSVVLDLLNFDRTTAVDSWRFEALVVVRGEVVLFHTYGGEPKNQRIERERNPLGPLQSTAESAAGQLLKW